MTAIHKTLRSYRMSAVAFALLTVTGAASASTTQEMNAVFRKYGFEYREAERPYGLPIKARLTRVKIGDDIHELDLASPLTRQGVDKAIDYYLSRHAANELHLISVLVGGPMGNIKKLVALFPFNYPHQSSQKRQEFLESQPPDFSAAVTKLEDLIFEHDNIEETLNTFLQREHEGKA